MTDLNKERRAMAEQLKKFEQAAREIHALADKLHSKMAELHEDAKATRERARAARRRAEARSKRRNLSPENPVQPQKRNQQSALTKKRETDL